MVVVRRKRQSLTAKIFEAMIMLLGGLWLLFLFNIFVLGGAPLWLFLPVNLIALGSILNLAISVL